MSRRAQLLALVIAGTALGGSPGDAAAQLPAGVSEFTFDDLEAGSEDGHAYDNRGVNLDNGCGGYSVTAIGPLPFAAHSGANALFLPGGSECRPNAYVTFTKAPPPLTVQFWARVYGPDGGTVSVTKLLVGAPAGVPAPVETRTLGPGWSRLTFTTTPEHPFAQIEPRGTVGSPLYLDDLAISSSLPPFVTTVIDEAPSARSSSSSASVRFHSSELGSTFACSLDGAAETPCSGVVTYDGLTEGQHEVLVRSTGYFGQNEATPPVVRWTVTRPEPPALTTPDPCLTGPDGDADGVPDVCEGPGLSGTLPPIEGERTRVRVISGEVFIKLPRASGARLRGLPAPGPLATREQVVDADADPGFVPLKGVATVPVGSTVDARAGSIDLVTATGASAGGAAPSTASARLSAAIFQIRQRRAARKRKGQKRPPPSPTQLLLQTPAATLASQLCADKRSTAAIRTLTAIVPKGRFQVVGSAATVTTTSPSATVRTTDRCDGTFTAVGSGTAHVRDAARHRTIRVRAGRGYLVRGRFLSQQVQKGR